MSDKKNWLSHIENKYTKEGYIDKYGGSVLITGLILSVFGGIFGYHYFMSNAKALKKNWAKVRCDPLVMPFAGIINAPPNGSKLEYTGENLGYCLNEILKDMVKVETAGINATQSVMKDTVSSISNAVQEGRKLISKIRSLAGGIFSSILGKILNVLLPIRSMLIKSLDSLNKVGSVGVTGLYTALAAALSVNGFFFMFLLVCIFVLLLVAGLIVAEAVAGFVLMDIPFIGWLLAIPDFILVLATTVFLISILVLFIPLISVIVDVLYLTRTVPQHRRRLIQLQNKTNAFKNSEGFENRQKHFCFDPETKLHVKNRGKIKIKNIKLNDILSDGGVVTSIVKVVNNNEKMYDLKGIKVTGRHKIDDENYGIISVENHPDSRLLENYWQSELYNINTTSKRIQINNFKFFDWDDMDDMDIATFRYETSGITPDSFANADIHKFMDSGLDGHTNIELEDGRSVLIKDLELNDQLKFGQRVLGIVKISGKTVDSVKEFKLENTKIIGTDNLKVFIKDLGVISLHHLNGKPIKNPDILYNIITDRESFIVNDIKLMDYCGNMEEILARSRNTNVPITA